MSVLIQTENLGRHFGPIKAVDGISFEVRRGEVLGFLGPNGAGKSTTMKMLTCFLTPSFGRARVGGYDIVEQSREVRSVLGYLPENAPLYGEMEVYDFLQFIAEVRGVPQEKRKAAIDAAVDRTSLGAVAEQRIETLSKGFKRRVGLAQAILHDPEILILDEPTDGLDPNQKHEVRTLINEMSAEKCIILSTHILEEVEEVCGRVVIISQGRIVADDTPEALKQRSRVYGALTVRFKMPVAEDMRSKLQTVSGIKEVLVEQRPGGENGRYTLIPENPDKALYSFLEKAKSEAWSIEQLSVEDGRLDEVFREITRTDQ